MIGAARVLQPERAGSSSGVGDGANEAWVMDQLAGFARLPGGFAARGGSTGNRCEDA
ncbi:MAG: hypothetical protein ACK5Q1_06725 [Limnobacter sp.]